MCGIFGEVALRSPGLTEKEFKSFNDKNILRGPDSDGYWKGENCQLGFRRLAILDLSENGNQPMTSPSGRWVMVFNGEVYNFLDIKKELKQKEFRGHSDSEVIINCIEENGVVETLQKLDGMFAIAVYDQQEKELWLARDFAGIKPVHYVPAPLGLLKQTHQLLPGEYLQVKQDGRLNKAFYYQLPKPSWNIHQHGEAMELLEAELAGAVRAEMVSDVALGTFLSGGIDSPLIASFAAKFSKEQLMAFSIGSDSKTHDESGQAQAYAELLHAQFHLDKMDSHAAANTIDGAVNSLKEPFGDFSIIPTWLVSKHARKNVIVALSGDGGDELFYGYERFGTIAKNLKFNKIPKGIRYPVYAADKVLFKGKHVNSGFLADNFGAAHQGVHSRFQHKQVAPIFPGMQTQTLHESFDVYNYEAKNESELLQHMQWGEFYGMMQKTLTKVDRASMANSLEVRVPFLKKSFIEASLKVSPYLSYGNGKQKQLLKDLLKKRLPQAQFGKDKKGFTIPLGTWMKEGLKEKFSEVLFDKNFLQKFGIAEKALQDMWQAQQKGFDHKWALFSMYTLAKWDEKQNAV
jgi:asparagine synthase (glutamine-hydrolysing)